MTCFRFSRFAGRVGMDVAKIAVRAYYERVPNTTVQGRLFDPGLAIRHYRCMSQFKPCDQKAKDAYLADAANSSIMAW